MTLALLIATLFFFITVIWPLTYIKRFERGLTEGKRLTPPTNKYEVVILPVSEELVPVELENPSRTVSLVSNVLARNDSVICYKAKNGYQVLIRNTAEGWYKVHGYENIRWAKLDESVDTLMGYVSMDDPNFHDELMKLEDKARTHIAILEAVA